MKGNRRNAAPAPVSPPPLSPTPKGSAKYTNKDGSKFITVPKPSAAGSSPPSSPATAATPSRPTHAPEDDEAVDDPLPTVNRKKAKRRAKAALKAAMGQTLSNGSVETEEHSNAKLTSTTYASHQPLHHPGNLNSQPTSHDRQENGLSHDDVTDLKKGKKKKGKSAMADLGQGGGGVLGHTTNLLSKEEIWNTSSYTERERIKEFWLGLGEDERKSLVKVEKEAVLKKMKEQQKHTCSCTVCGRKRTAIEEELEGLYDAYYDELEQYAHDPNAHPPPPMLRSMQHPGSMRGMHTHRPGHSVQQPSHGRIVEHVGDDEDDDEDDYSEDELLDDDDEEFISEGEEDLPPDEPPQDHPSDFLGFGNSLTVQGGILTVADDLLKNDGKKFIEMMEQLAERRMAREEETRDQISRGYVHDVVNGGYASNRPPSEDDEYGPEDEGDDYDSPEDDEELEDDEEVMTDEQRLKEGRKMFQIFAARMFEQRVLTAYREKVAKERQQMLLEELDEEGRQDTQRKAKKAKEAQKRKEKNAQKKQAQAEERARKDAEKVAEEERRKAEESRRLEEQRIKNEENNRKKEQKRLEILERERKAREEKERREKQERDVREQKKKAQEDARLKEKDARERKEREAQERREKQERDKREKTARAKENEAKEKQQQAQRAASKKAAAAAAAAAVASPAIPITLPKRPAQQAPAVPVPALPQLSQQPPAAFSPQVTVATPALPKAPTPVRPRQLSQQGANVAISRTTSLSGSGHSQNTSPPGLTPIGTSPAVPSLTMPAMKPISMTPLLSGASLQATSPATVAARPALHFAPYPLPQMPSNGAFNAPVGHVQPPPGFGGPPFQPTGSTYRAPGPPTMPPPPGLHSAGRGFPPMAPPPGFGHFPQDVPPGLGPFGSLPRDIPPGPQHVRQSSGGFDPAGPAPPAQPIARPTPIARPGSVVHGQRSASGQAIGEVDESSNAHHLGSKALLDDSDAPLDDLGPRGPALGQRSPFPPAPPPFGAGHSAPGGFPGQSPFWGNPLPPPGSHNNAFAPLGSSGAFPPGGWGNAPFAAPGGTQGRYSRSSMVRQNLCRACNELSKVAKAKDPTADDYVPFHEVFAHVDSLMRNTGNVTSEAELMDLCDTEGNALNGGGVFDIRRDDHGNIVAVKWQSNSLEDLFPRSRPGDVGSPIISAADQANLWGPPQVDLRR